MTDELIDICDENNDLLNIQKKRSEAHRNGLWHRTSHIWIYNSKKEILLQLRAKNKETHPDKWDISVAGHVTAGQDPVTSGLREIEEEIGLKIKQEDLEFWKIKKREGIFKDIKDNEFHYVFFLKYDGDVSQLHVQEKEVQRIQFVSVDQVEKELKFHPDKYVPHGDYWFEVLYEIKKRFV